MEGYVKNHEACYFTTNTNCHSIEVAFQLFSYGVIIKLKALYRLEPFTKRKMASVKIIIGDLSCLPLYRHCAYKYCMARVKSAHSL